MFRTTVSVAVALFNSRSGASDAMVVLVGFFMSAFMLLFILLLPAFFGVGLLGMKKELSRFFRAPEK